MLTPTAETIKVLAVCLVKLKKPVVQPERPKVWVTHIWAREGLQIVKCEGYSFMSPKQ